MARAGSCGLVCGQQVAVSPVSPVSRTFSSQAVCSGDTHSVSFRSRPGVEDLPFRFRLELRKAVVPPTTAALRRHSISAAVDVEVGGAPSKEGRRPETVTWTKDLANSVSLIGNIGRDVDIKYLDNNRVFAKTSVAVNRGGNKTDSPSWFELEFWDPLAQIAHESLKKGAWVHIQGKIFVEAWVDAQEAKRTTTKIVVGEFNFVQSDGRAPTSSPPSSGGQESKQSDSPPTGKPPLSKERLWQEYFSDRSQWWDNRGKKLSPKSPDFKHKSTGEALWIEGYNTPAWVKEKFAKDESGEEAGEETGDLVLRESVKPGKSKSSSESVGWGDF